MATPTQFPALLVREAPAGETERAVAAVETLCVGDLPPGDVLIDVACSSLNYKDALACQGHPGVAAKLPHVPGIDCAGVVRQCDSGHFSAGDAVLVTGYGLGSDAWGGYSGCVRVPAGWLLPLPAGLDARSAMTYGTAGFTAAQSVAALLAGGVEPGQGPVLVTGASGGVGVFSVAILAKLGFEVVAMSGKPDMAPPLATLGASRVIGRDALPGGEGPLLKATWAGGVDTVGGETLARLLRSTRYRGCVAACGLAASADLPLTVYPFILRGVTLAGIDSAKCPAGPRREVWEKLAGPWSVELPPGLVTTIDLDGVADRAAEMLAGKTRGRTLVMPRSSRPDEAG
ncbi:MAG: YhdH/YhfP family quinone oxidoreductase [Planctomycetota bacterium]